MNNGSPLLPLPTLVEATTALRHSMQRFGMTLPEVMQSLAEVRHLWPSPCGDTLFVLEAPAAEYRVGDAIYDERGVSICPALAFETAVNWNGRGEDGVPVLRQYNAF
jgi:hypothetical protein